jgi:hypothetical protein
MYTDEVEALNYSGKVLMLILLAWICLPFSHLTPLTDVSCIITISRIKILLPTCLHRSQIHTIKSTFLAVFIIYNLRCDIFKF